MNLFNGVLPITGISFLVFCIFIIAAVGYALGRITIKGVSLGTAGVFIVALLFGCFFYNEFNAQLGVSAVSGEAVYYTKNALKIVENIGLALFVSAVGFIAGPKFFSNLKKNFKSYVLLGLIIIIAGGLVSIACIYIGRLQGNLNNDELTAMVVGLLSGALTSTPAFSAAKATVATQYEDVVSVGHGIAYIFGVIGVVLFVQLVPKIAKADMKKERELAAGASDVKAKKIDFDKLFKLDDFGFLPFFGVSAIGMLLGAIKIPLTSSGLSGTCFSLTTTGGCLLTSLIFGYLGNIGKVSVTPSDFTLKVFRELGLMLFLIGAGIAGGASFVKYFHLTYFIYGIFMTIVPMIIGYIFAKYVLKLSLLNNLGSITGGMTSTPALGTLIRVAGTEDVAAAYAATYPIALIAVVLISQFLVILF